MKTIAKRLFATILATALMCTMVTGFAANTASVETIKILDNGEVVKTYDSSTTFDNIDVTEGQLIEVTAKLTDAELNALGEGDLTFLSRIVSEAGLSNNTIHYVAQATVNASGIATFTFRPRTSVGFGAAVANIGGTDVDEADGFNYDVLEAKEQLGLTAKNASIKEDSADDITFTVTGYVDGQAFDAVAIDGVALAADAWAFDAETKVLTIYNNKLASKAVKTYTVTISGSHYLDGVGEFEITKKDPVVLNLKAVNDVVTLPENSNDNIQFTIEGYTEGDLTITLTLNGEEVAADIERTENLLVIKNKAVGKYVVTVSGEDYVTATAEFEITAKPLDQLELKNASPASIEVDDNDSNIKFELVGVIENQAITVKIGEKTLVANTEYTYTDGILTILNNAITKEIATYTVTVEGTGYQAATATFEVVADSSVKLTIEGLSTTIKEDNEEDGITFTIDGYNAEKAITVKIDDVVVDAQYVSVEGTTLTIANGGLNLAVGTHKVVVSGTGYYTSNEATYTVTEKVVVPPVTPDDDFTEEEAEAAKDAILDIDLTISDNNKVTIPATVSVGEKNIPVEHNVTCKDVAVTAVDGVITYDSNAAGAPFVSKAEVSIWVDGSEDAARTETIYFIHPNTTAEEITFGNVTAIADEDGQDAFASKESFDAAMSDAEMKVEILATRAKALNVVLGRRPNIVHNNTLNFDKDDKITLNEYRIFKLMLDEDGTKPDAFTYENVMRAWFGTDSE